MEGIAIFLPSTGASAGAGWDMGSEMMTRTEDIVRIPLFVGGESPLEDLKKLGLEIDDLWLQK